MFSLDYLGIVIMYVGLAIVIMKQTTGADILNKFNPLKDRLLFLSGVVLFSAGGAMMRIY